MKSKIKINKKSFTFKIDGQYSWGKDEILFKKSTNSLANVNWKNNGYKKIKILNKLDFLKLKTDISNLLFKLIFTEFKTKVKKLDFKMEQYHNYVSGEASHNKIIKKTRKLNLDQFNRKLMNKILKVCSKNLNKNLTFRNPKLRKEIIILRLNRPKSLDINPPHRDGYLKIWRNVINLWIPISGCGSLSSLPLIPGSHLISEKKILRTRSSGSKINGKLYRVPSIIKIKNDVINMIRPNPKYGEALIFTPFLIHGSAINLEKNKTRASLELRLHVLE